MTLAPDPSDKLDAQSDGNFGSSGSNRRAGYSKDKLANAEYWARKGGTLNAGEGLVLCEEIDRLRNLTVEDHIAALVAMGAERGLASQMYYDADVLYLPPEMTP